MLSDKIVREALESAAHRLFSDDTSRPDSYAKQVTAHAHPVVITAQANLEGGGTEASLKDATTGRVNQLAEWLQKRSEADV